MMLAAPEIAAQIYPHPTVAPPHPAMQPPLDLSQMRSPWFSYSDGFWGVGEGFPFAIGTSEVGGVLANAYDPAAVRPNIADTVSTTGMPPARWQATQRQPTVLEARGFFWPALAGPPPAANQHRSGWSVLAPASRVQSGANTNRRLVLVIVFHESDGVTKVLPGFTSPYPYVAGADPFGLIAPGFPSPLEDCIAEAEANKDYDLVMAYAVMPHGARPYPMTLQRGLELVTFVKDLFLNEVPGQQTFAAVIATGGSHGCGNAMLAPTLFPGVFHGGMGSGHPPDFTLPFFSHEFQRWTTSHLGCRGAQPFSTYDALGIAFVEKYTGGNPAALSVPARFRAQATAGGLAHFLQRPLYLITGDEDPTDAGEDWMTLLGVSGPQEPYALEIIDVPNADPSVKLFLSRADKACHSTEIAVVADPNPPAGGTTSDLTIPLFFLIEHVLGSNPPPPVYLPGTTQVPAPPASFVDSYLRSFDGIFGKHIPTHPLTPLPTWPGRELTRMASWPKVAGKPINHAGTRLGEGEALKVYALGSETCVYVGSAEGVVSRFRLSSSVFAGATERYFELVAQSPDLGYGAWALDVGDVGATSPRVAVATAMGLHLLDATTLAVMATVPLSEPKEFRPSRLQIANLDGQGGGEVIFSTLGGRLAVYDSALNRVAWLDEPGICDFAVAPAGTAAPGGVNLSNETFGRPIYLALERGHVVSVVLQPPSASGIQAYLLAASPGETGNAMDLNLTSGGLLCTYLENDKAGDRWAHRLFHLTTLQRLFSLGEIPPLEGMPPIPLPLGGIRTCVSTAGGQARYIVLRQDTLYVYSPMGEVLGKKVLGSYPPAVNAVSVAVGNIDGSGGNEIIVSTAAGRLVWFRLSELTAAGDTFPSFGSARWTALDRANPSLAATWAMTYGEGKLQLVDQSGIQYEVDPATGESAFRWNYGFGIPTLAIPGPHRRLISVGQLDGPPSSVGAPCWVDVSASPRLAQIGREAPSPGVAPPGLLYPSFALGGYWLASAGGAAYAEASGDTRLWWWNGAVFSDVAPFAHDIVLGARIQGSPGSRVLADMLSTSDGSNWDGRVRLRNNMADAGRIETSDLQNMGVGHVLGRTDPEVVLSTLGGSVLLLDGANVSGRANLIPNAESADFGWGGIALAVGDLNADGQPEVLHGTLYSNQRFANEQQAATLQILKGSSGALALAHHGQPPAPFAFSTHDPAYPLVGIAGIAIGEIYADPMGPEVVVTTIDGYLYVFGVSNHGGPGSPSFHLNLLSTVAQIGALGAHSSIHIGDHARNGTARAEPDGKAEIYVAGSMGLRRFDAP